RTAPATSRAAASSRRGLFQLPLAGRHRRRRAGVSTAAGTAAAAGSAAVSASAPASAGGVPSGGGLSSSGISTPPMKPGTSSPTPKGRLSAGHQAGWAALSPSSSAPARCGDDGTAAGGGAGSGPDGAAGRGPGTIRPRTPLVRPGRLVRSVAGALPVARDPGSRCTGTAAGALAAGGGAVSGSGPEM